MFSKIHIDKSFFIIFGVLILFCFGNYFFNKFRKNRIILIKAKQPSYQYEPVIPELLLPPGPQIDPVKDYDTKKLLDPLSDPTRRVSRDQLAQLPIEYTQGPPDTYSIVGFLQKSGTTDSTDPERILQLYGRKILLGGNQWDYYVTKSTNSNEIKIPLRDKTHSELMNEQEIIVDSFGGATYIVNLYKFDAPVYNPFTLF